MVSILPGLSINTQNHGVSQTATSQENNSAIITVQNREPAYSPVASGENPIGEKARKPTTVPPSSGHLVWFTMATEALAGDSPRCTLTSVPSTTTMALSTSIPSAMISAPSEIRCMSSPYNNMPNSVPAMVTNRMPPIRMPDRSPMNTSKVPTTITSASTTFITKELTDSRTLAP